MDALTQKQAEKGFKSKGFKLNDTYVNNKDKLNVSCIKCKRELKMAYGNTIRRKTIGCGKCGLNDYQEEGNERTSITYIFTDSKKKKIIKDTGYCIDKEGNVYGKKGNIMKPYTDKSRYLNIKLRYNEDKYSHQIHRLVAETFIPNPRNCLEVNHKDKTRNNNNVKNLEWCTSKENKVHAYSKGDCKLEHVKVYQYDLEENFIEEFKSIKSVKEETGVDLYNVKNKKDYIDEFVKYNKFLWKFDYVNGDRVDVDIDGINWKIIKEFKNYAVSKKGEVYSIRKKMIMKLHIKDVEYKTIKLFKDGKHCQKRVHVLVARAFLGKKDDEDKIVNHKDGDKFNNNVKNLEYITRTENNIHAAKLGKGGSRAVVQFEEDGETEISRFYSINCAEQKTGENADYISLKCRGSLPQNGKYVWKFAKDVD